MASVIDVKKERVWTALLDGFEKYLAVLTERAALIQETDALKQQVSKRWYSYARFGGDIFCAILYQTGLSKRFRIAGAIFFQSGI